jgi:hypothetical protein
MSTVAQRKVTIVLSGDVAGTQEYEAEDNDASPAWLAIGTLAAGNNTFLVPTGGSTPRAFTITKPSDNTVALTLKGVNGDTGIRLHDTDPDSFSLDSSVTQIVIHAAAEVVGIRIM